MALQLYTALYSFIQRYTALYSFIQLYTALYSVIQRCTGVYYAAIQPIQYTALYYHPLILNCPVTAGVPIYMYWPFIYGPLWTE